jgi:DNA-directed RNA polymerase sigma subunit (sigma70/sigma32)
VIKLQWQECDWTTIHDDKRPTENAAFRNVKLQAKFYLRFGDKSTLKPLYKRIARKERFLLSKNYDHMSCVTQLSKEFSISEQKVREILHFCTIWSYYNEIYCIN